MSLQTKKEFFKKKLDKIFHNCNGIEFHLARLDNEGAIDKINELNNENKEISRLLNKRIDKL